MNEGNTELSKEKKVKKEKKEKLPYKERRRLWKEAKKAKRQEQKDFYKYAPWPKRIWELYAKAPVRAIAIILILSILLYVNRQAIYNLYMDAWVSYYLSTNTRTVPTEEEIALMHQESPIDEEGAAKIDALPRFGEDETWTICVYIVGSNLEDYNDDNLSNLTAFKADQFKEEYNQNKKKDYLATITRFENELKANSLEIPAFFYEPTVPKASSISDGWSPRLNGAATSDIIEMLKGEWSENIKIVIQTGGARHWDNSRVNPNRTQRFLYEKGTFSEVGNMALQKATDPETLADFVRFCKNKYPSDHQMLVLWNHGAGPFGYGVDSIYGDMMSLTDIRTALSKVYSPNINNAPFDIIGFDACLMSTIEVTHALYGFADYYCLSEETEPGDGWDYTPVLTAMTEDPTMNAAMVGRCIADAYTDFYMQDAITTTQNRNSVTFSVIDGRNAERLYEAYGNLSKALLRDSAKDISVLALASRCANASTRYGGSSHNVMNTVDVGNYVSLLRDYYPNECDTITNLLKETVLYHRENGALADSTGIATYFPAEVNNLTGLVYFLEYEYDICEDEAVKTLYYYKQAGCLTEDMKDFVATLTDDTPKTLDVELFRQFAMEDPVIGSNGFTIAMPPGLLDMVVKYQLGVNRLDTQNGKMIEYGCDDVLSVSEDGTLSCEFDGKWLHMNGQPLYSGVVSSTDSTIEYKALISYNGAEAYLLLSADKETDEISVVGLMMHDEYSSVMSASRSMTQLQNGARIAPLYVVTDISTGQVYTDTGKTITYSEKTKFTKQSFKDGKYVMSAVISDQRGDNYYSLVISAEAHKGTLKNWALEPGYYARDYH
ncbi:clostripain-related cysteine peptidase [Butyrivibrio proteoclasticus]|uniref:clostripain-related cysteine peptidase n=1 Tax=Butyrivibrio proteoclasticus TaxID=43305 RepID=UPI00047E7E0D|nr:clostripain-related cysteine peptidase [Butyrivibrio proteoclasticus]